MSRWSDEFENHPIHELLSQAEVYLETEVEDTDAAFEDERRRLKNVMDNLHQLVAGLDHEFYPKQWLDQLQQHFNQHVLNQLRAYSDNPDISQLRAANDQATTQIPKIYNLAAMSRPLESQEVIANAQQALRSFMSSIEATANETDERFTKHEAALTAVSEKAEVLSRSFDVLDKSTNDKLAEWQDDFVEKQTVRVQDHSDAQIERDRQFAVALKAQQDAFEQERTGIVEIQNARFNAAFDGFRLARENASKDIKEKQAAIRTLHDLVTDETVAGGYHKSAKDEKVEADRWRNRSLICLGLAVLWLGTKYVIGFATTEEGAINWPDILTVSSLTAILLYAAGYTSRQSTMHRNNEKSLRSYALETQALDPFIASLKIGEQQAIKAELVRRMFGQQNARSSGEAVKMDEGTIKTLVDKVSDSVTEVVGKVIDKG
ncbi:hypothetical protein K3757_11450 [Sulfitobacter sp. S223]|uniref:hypothetical protein n=1 Tax=Sulfitobacter sp. S223 TaxID=2867023 RepID=UPI0021A51516|nr:hypothetical protein [Sulfitobacter sp. S223]UWR25090.1 hypothetical protein K3757_11450 [Sulfitobacter sp. S223]